MPEMTERQTKAWPSALEEVRLYDVEIRDDVDSYGWLVTWADEVRPGRGQDLDACWVDGEHFAQIRMDVYGGYTVSIAETNWIHNSSDEECACEPCVSYRAKEES